MGIQMEAGRRSSILRLHSTTLAPGRHHPLDPYVILFAFYKCATLYRVRRLVSMTVASVCLE